MLSLAGLIRFAAIHVPGFLRIMLQKCVRYCNKKYFPLLLSYDVFFTVITTIPTTATTQATTHRVREMSERCDDKNRFCNEWASQGDCSTLPKFMEENCPKSCSMCVETEPCEDRSSTCSDWTSHCTNSAYSTSLAIYCRKTCNLCSGGSANDVSGIALFVLNLVLQADFVDLSVYCICSIRISN